MRKNKIKKFWKEHSGIICCVGAVITGGVLVIATLADANKLDDESEENVEIKNHNGRDCLITCTDEDTGEVLWEERVYEEKVR